MPVVVTWRISLLWRANRARHCSIGWGVYSLIRSFGVADDADYFSERVCWSFTGNSWWMFAMLVWTLEDWMLNDNHHLSTCKQHYSPTISQHRNSTLELKFVPLFICFLNGTILTCMQKPSMSQVFLQDAQSIYALPVFYSRKACLLLLTEIIHNKSMYHK